MVTIAFVLFSKPFTYWPFSTAWTSLPTPLFFLWQIDLKAHDKKKKSLHVKISIRNVLSYQVPEALYGPY